MASHRFNYRWYLSDGFPAPGVENHGATVFGTFICGGGSSMGYKLAGFHHLGGVEIDPKVAKVYAHNHRPEMLYVEDLRRFNGRDDLPDALYNLDVLDGSPPCTTFSMTGSREKSWGKRKQFREGQVKQTLDDLVFVYCDTIAKLRPRVCLLENVAGIVKGNARSYCRGIVSRLKDAGYRVQIFLLNAARMGVPQHRQRTFFIGLRDDFAELPKLRIDVAEEPILFGEVFDKDDRRKELDGRDYEIWSMRRPCDVAFNSILVRNEGRDYRFNWKIVQRNRVCPTLCADDMNFAYDYPRRLNGTELSLCSSFPLDYECTRKELTFMTGMCVPPVMIAHIADAIWNQWLKPIKARR